MKKEVDIWTVVSGQLKEIKLEEEIYTVDKKKLENKQTSLDKFGMFMSTKPVETTKPVVTKMIKKKGITPQEKTANTKKYLKELGVHFIGKHQNMRIIKEAVDSLWNKSREESLKILRRYYPTVKDESLERYLQTYSAFMNKLKSKKEHPRGKKVKVMGAQTIYENPFNEVKELIDSGKESTEHIRPILTKYYPMYQPQTITSLCSVYRRAITGKYIRNSKKRKKSEKFKPNDAIGWSDTYKIWIKKEEYHGIYRNIVTMNYKDKSKCTSEFLAEKMKMTSFRTRAVLKYMLEKGKIKQSYNKAGKPTYHP